jgi:hypothetical protein
MDQQDAARRAIPPADERPRSARRRARLKALSWYLGAAALVIVVIVAVAVNSNNNSASGNSAASSTTTPVSSSQGAAAGQVTYTCAGSAPRGVYIDYGPSKSPLDAHSLPFSATSTFDPGEIFYVTEAILNGSGKVSCTTTIKRPGVRELVATASVAGGRSTAMAELCSTDPSGAWVTC